MSERFLKRRYKSHQKANLFEFITETSAYMAAVTMVDKYYHADEKHVTDIITPLIYYAYKDLLLPKVIEAVVYWLAEFSIGRFIIKKLRKLERHRAVVAIINTLTIITIMNITGREVDFIDVLLLQIVEMGADIASDAVF